MCYLVSICFFLNASYRHPLLHPFIKAQIDGGLISKFSIFLKLFFAKKLMALELALIK
jgi:hypothetical protein